MALLHPLAAYLLHRSLPTLPFRVREAQERARALARLLAEHPAVERVLYPEADGVQLRGPGAVLAFEVAGGQAAAATVMESRAARHARRQPGRDGLADPAPGRASRTGSSTRPSGRTRVSRTACCA